ncbi:MAG: phenylacetic acid degradation protein PaaD [Actinomycetia bacterium]|nr:phenylacetic acid degradation protein PaaD [Actinomycetes bacterium]
MADPATGTHENRAELDALFRADTLARTLNLELVDWSGGEARVTGTPTEEHCNFLGGVHGGFLYSAADVAMSVASNSWGRAAVAVSIDMQYAAGARPGDVLEFAATEQTRSRRIGNYRLVVVRGERTIATATGLTYRTDDWLLGAEAWSDHWRSRL